MRAVVGFALTAGYFFNAIKQNWLLVLADQRTLLSARTELCVVELNVSLRRFIVALHAFLCKNCSNNRILTYLLELECSFPLMQQSAKSRCYSKIAEILNIKNFQAVFIINAFGNNIQIAFFLAGDTALPSITSCQSLCT
jgi:hypothetical protein